MRALIGIIAAVLAAACGVTNYSEVDRPRYSGGSSLGPSAADELRVATFNIEFSERIELALAELRAAGLDEADALALQEMDREGCEQIAQSLGMNWVYYPASVHNHGRDFGNAVLSRWPIAADHKLLLSHGAPFDGRRRIAVAAEIAHPTRPFVLYSVHNETVLLNLDARLDQVREILADRSARYPSETAVVIAGDFNTAGSGGLEQTVTLHTDAGFTSAAPIDLETADNAVGGRALDHIFVRGLELLEHGVGPDRGASDHRVLWALVR